MLKFSRAQSVSEIAGSAILEVLPVLGSQTLVVHIPTAGSRYRQRGYDQAKLIAQVVAARRELEYSPALRRSGDVRQVGAGRKLRFTQMQHLFYVHDPRNVAGRDVLLVDDVLTTGATLQACAKVLKAAGARRVSAVVFAQKE